MGLTTAGHHADQRKRGRAEEIGTLFSSWGGFGRGGGKTAGVRREEENQDTGEGLASEEATVGKRQHITDGLTVSTNRGETLFSVYSR